MLFNRKKRSFRVSLCIPVYNSERYLGRCLESIATQNFSDIEIVLINDCSSGKDEKGRGCRRIALSFQKKSKLPLVYIEHFHHIPLLETRRQLVEQSHGDYIFMLDSDDLLAENAIQILYDSAIKTGADITCGAERIYSIKNNQLEYSQEHYSLHNEGFYKDREVFDQFLVKRTCSGFLWAKLIKKDLYIKAFSEIPFIDCSFSEDTLIYFFVSYFGKSYCAIKDVVYYHLLNSGVSTVSVINDLKSWRRHCTSSSVFSFLLSYEADFTEEERDCIQRLSRTHLRNAILLLRKTVVPELYEEAYEMLCNYWGKSFVQTIEERIDNK